LLFVGDDWAEDHHDVELMDASGRKLSKARLPEGVAGMARLHAMIGAQLGEGADELADQVVVGIETDRGPITRASGRKKTVLARHIHNDRLVDALGVQAFASLQASPGARAYYDQLRARDVSHFAALRQLGNRLVGILHGCLKTSTLYDESTAWSHRTEKAAA
jgi:hypothetical protein